jgi:hypothetical protein
MAIMTSYCFYIYMIIKKFKSNPLDEIFNFNFNLRPLKVNNNALHMNQFRKGL